MHIVLANLFRRYKFEMAPGTDDGMEWVDRVMVHPKRSLYVKVKSKDCGMR